MDRVLVVGAGVFGVTAALELRRRRHAVRLVDPAVLNQRLGGRVSVGPDTFLERSPELRVVRLANEVVALVVEGGVEEEAVVIELEMAVFLPDPTFTERQKLLAFGKRADGYGPFFERDWHVRC